MKEYQFQYTIKIIIIIASAMALKSRSNFINILIETSQHIKYSPFFLRRQIAKKSPSCRPSCIRFPTDSVKKREVPNTV